MLLRPPYSGVEYAIEHLARGLADELPEGLDIYVPHGFSAAPHARWRLHRAARAARGRMGRILFEQLCLPRRMLAARCELLHAPGYVAPLAGKLPLVLTVYDALALRHPELCRPVNRWHYRMLMPASVHKAARVIVPSRATLADLVACTGINEQKIRVIPLAPRPGFAPQDEAARLRARTRWAEGKPYLLFTGNLEPRKNIPFLLRVFQRFRTAVRNDHKLVLAGRHAHGTQLVRAEITRLELGKDVFLPGYVPEAEFANLMAGAEVFLFPARGEGFGLPVLEAMAAGVPVVATEDGSIPEIAGPAALLAGDEEAAWVNALFHLLGSQALRLAVIQWGIKRAAQFSWRTAALATLEVYREVLEERSR